MQRMDTQECAKMEPATVRVLLVLDDDGAIATLTHHLITQIQANVTIAATLAEAEKASCEHSFDVIIAAHSLADGSGLALMQEHPSEIETPLILLDEELDGDRVLSALRAGAIDVLPQPFDLKRLSTVVRESVRQCRERARDETRRDRLRRLSSRMIEDRRELRRRVDLVCRDLVQAYRQLAEKVVARSR